MKDIDHNLTDWQMDFISFKEFVEQITGVSFEEFYEDYLLHGAKNEQGNME